MNRARAKIAEAKYDAAYREQRRVAARERMTRIRSVDREGYNVRMRAYRATETGKAVIQRSENRIERKAYLASFRKLPKTMSQQLAYRSTPERKDIIRNQALIRKYNSTSEQYEAILTKQGGVCGICHEPKPYRLSVDHDHVTGTVRGLLCRDCNLGIGFLNDSIATLQAAITYLTDK